MTQHTIKRFSDELDTLKEHVLSMGGLIEQAVGHAVKSMLEQDERLANRTIERDRAINALEVECDEMTRDILVRRQPAAGDLRFIMGIVKVVTDLERMGDLAANISKGTLSSLRKPPRYFSNLDIMGEKAQLQVIAALDALAHGDVDLAMKVIEKDKVIDALYKRMYREMITYMMEDARDISSCFILTNVGKDLERISDHATNIAEMVIYMERGHDIRHVNHEAATKLLSGEEI
ncbi:MAG: phosphate signaling complex protein PhoU [Mariprofundaceae bacterium]|nr:phosphate signaling complex protein PhoU [Mariprofundaceae bacterium]